MNKNAKYDTDFVTLRDLKNYMSADGEGTDNIIRIIPKSYAAPPHPPYYVGSILYYEHSVYRCKTERKLGNFNWDDWSIVATDNDVLLTWINNTYVVDKAALQAQIDQKAETYYQATDPATWTTDLEKSKHVGDFWYNTTSNTQWRYSQFDTNPITYGWRQVNVPNAVFDLIDTKKSIYVSKPTSYNANDLWIIESTLPDADLPVGTASNPIVKGDWVFATQDSTTYNKAHWVKLDEDVSMSYLEDNYYTSDDVDDIADTKVDTSNYTKQAIIQKINDTTSQVKIEADSINLNGAVTANNNFKIKNDGSVEINDGTIDLTDTGASETVPKIKITSLNSNLISELSSLGLQIKSTTDNVRTQIRATRWEIVGSATQTSIQDGAIEMENTDYLTSLLNPVSGQSVAFVTGYQGQPAIKMSNFAGFGKLEVNGDLHTPILDLFNDTSGNTWQDMMKNKLDYCIANINTSKTNAMAFINGGWYGNDYGFGLFSKMGNNYQLVWFDYSNIFHCRYISNVGNYEYHQYV